MQKVMYDLKKQIIEYVSDVGRPCQVPRDWRSVAHAMARIGILTEQIARTEKGPHREYYYSLSAAAARFQERISKEK